MGRRSIDQTGQVWDITWGTGNPGHTLEADYGIMGHAKRTGDYAVFQDPLYPEETKTLALYALVDPSGPHLYAEAEITPGVYAVGVKI